jgi:hypothetical protein
MMNNQWVLWSMLILPWATLLFFDKKELRRFMPVALLSTVITSMVMEAGITMGLWKIKQTLYPLNQTIPYIYGLAPVVTLWVFKYTFRRFWTYLALDATFNLVFVYLFTPWLVRLGIKDFTTSGLTLLVLVTAISLLLYLYQLWQEESQTARGHAYARPQAANKPGHHRDDQH